MKSSIISFACICFAQLAIALERPGVEFQIFQFPADAIPRIDGNTDDWDMVPESFAIGADQLRDVRINPGAKVDPETLDVKVKVGWVKGMNQLYFLYEAWDNYWDFALANRHNDIFELVVDADLSGGPFISRMHPNKDLTPMEAHQSFHGVHAQNHHINTPHEGQDWDFVWGSQPWIKDLPYGNAAYNYDFKPGESGKLVLEFWITPFDHAPADPARAIISQLVENEIIGMSWAVLDYDDVNNPDSRAYTGFYSLSHEFDMIGNGNHMVAFRLMPLEARFRDPLEAAWEFQVIDMKRRLVAFQDESYGDITDWKWDFGDGNESTKQHPIHSYSEPGEYVVILNIEGPSGKDRHIRVRAVAVK
jgi:hypothetical protein